MLTYFEHHCTIAILRFCPLIASQFKYNTYSIKPKQFRSDSVLFTYFEHHGCNDCCFDHHVAVKIEYVRTQSSQIFFVGIVFCLLILSTMAVMIAALTITSQVNRTCTQSSQIYFVRTVFCLLILSTMAVMIAASTITSQVNRIRTQSRQTHLSFFRSDHVFLLVYSFEYWLYLLLLLCTQSRQIFQAMPITVFGPAHIASLLVQVLNQVKLDSGQGHKPGR